VKNLSFNKTIKVFFLSLKSSICSACASERPILSISKKGSVILAKNVRLFLNVRYK